MPAKAKLTTRSTATTTVTADNLAKGTELSFNEADSNFINLRDQSIAISDGVTTTDIEAGETITFSGASVSGNTVTITGGGGSTGLIFVGDDSTGTLISDGETIKIAGTGGITVAVANDTVTIDGSGVSGGGGSANLGNLQVNDTTLSPITTNDNITLQANGTGKVEIIGNYNLLGISGRFGDSSNDGSVLNYSVGKSLSIGSYFGQAGAYTKYQYDGNIITKLASGSSTIRIDSLTGNSTSYSRLDIGIPASGPTITAVATGVSNQNITITPAGTGYLVLDGLNWPTSDGANGEVLTTDGAGNLSWGAGGGISLPSQTGNAGKYLTTDGSNLSWDTIASPGGDLTFTGSTISSPSNANLTLDPSGTGKIVLSADLEINGKIFTGASAITLAPDTTSTADLSTNGEPFILLTPTASGGHAQITVADTKYIYLTTDGYTGGNYGIVMNNNGITLAPKGTSRVNFATATSSTIGANGAASALTANPVGYLKIKVNGTEYQIPYYNI